MAKVQPRLISLLMGDSGSETDRSNEVSSAIISSAASDSDFVTFADARSGGARDYTLKLTLAQDHTTGTLWDEIWSSAGDEISGVYAPYGNTTASATQPHYEFTAVVSEPDGDFLGADADSSTTAVATVDVEWSLTGKPVKVVA